MGNNMIDDYEDSDTKFYDDNSFSTVKKTRYDKSKCEFSEKWLQYRSVSVDESREAKMESMHVGAGQHGWALQDEPGKFLFLILVKWSMIERSFYRQVVIKSGTKMRLEKGKQHPRNIRWKMRCLNKLIQGG